MTEAKPSVVFVLGGPGAGKGTQCAKIVENCGYKHISAGDCLREEQERPGSAHGELIRDCIKGGKIVPVEVTCELLKEKMKANGWEKSKFLIDGFPRNRNNLDGWESVMGDNVDVSFCLFLDCGEEVMCERLMKRSAHSGREDDNMESIKKRFHTYQCDTMPIIELFRQRNKCKTVNADQSVDAVWKEVQTCMN